MAISAKIPVVIQKSNGVEQTFWVSLDNFNKLKRKGIKVKSVDTGAGPKIKGTVNVFSRKYEDLFMKDFIKDGKASIQFGPDTFNVEMTAFVDIKKNGESIKKLKIMLNREKLARAIFENIQVGK